LSSWAALFFSTPSLLINKERSDRDERWRKIWRTSRRRIGGQSSERAMVEGEGLFAWCPDWSDTMVNMEGCYALEN
jgi:hypothetical protein